MNQHKQRILLETVEDYQVVLHALFCAAATAEQYDIPDTLKQQLSSFSTHFIDERRNIVCETLTDESFAPVIEQQNEFMARDMVTRLQKVVDKKMTELLAPEVTHPGDGTVVTPVVVTIGSPDDPLLMLGLGTITVNLAGIELNRLRAIAPPLVGILHATCQELIAIHDSEENNT
jgi:hypothetical protein